MAKEFGDVMAEVAASASDGTISDNELARVHRQWGELMNAGNRVLKQLAAMNAAGKPRTELGWPKGRSPVAKW